MTKNDKMTFEFINAFCENVRSGFDFRMSLIKPKLSKQFIHQGMGGLLARQTSLALELASAPPIWNPHSAPLLLRAMVEAHINLCWILKDIEDRSKKFIEYGLGQEKLLLEHLNEVVDSETDEHLKSELSNMVKFRKQWLDAQIAEWATEVNIGSWSGISIREMATDVNLQSLYKFSYMPFSGVTHNTWQHIGVYNVDQCSNPMHKFHFVPRVKPLNIDPHFLLLASRYLSLSFEAIDEHFELEKKITLPIDFFFENEPFSDTS